MRRLALMLLPVLLAGSLGACSGSTSSGLPQVSGKFGDKPKVTVDKGATPSKKLQSSVLSEGHGHKVAKGDLIVVNYLGENFRSRKVFDNSYDKKVPVAFPIGTGRVIPGWDKTLVGVKAGSRVLMVVPPKQGYGKKGNAGAKIKGTDSLVFVVDVLGSYAKTGNTVKNTPVAGLPTDLPTVTGPSGAKPAIAIKAGTTPPKKPVVTVLAKGTGPVVSQGMLAVVDFTAVKWSGDPLSSTFSKDATSGVAPGPQGVQIAGQQPSPFDLLTGVPSGSRVLLTLPAQTGADASKESVAAVVDVIAAYGSVKGAK